MARVLSCIQPTGGVHLGNLLGALQPWVDVQSADSFHGIVDLHALTVPQDPAELREATLELVRILLAIGLDPDFCTLFVQSHVSEHAELAWLMQCTAGYGELGRMTQFKDKSAKSESFSAALFTYPALMAADILLYDADQVPVGEDQRQHLELTRDLAIRFNSRYGEDTFVVPEPVIGTVAARVMDLQNPTNKMSKSADGDNGLIFVLDDLKRVEKKLKRAVTDNEATVRFAPDTQPGVANLLSILSVATGEGPDKLAERYDQYGQLKVDTAEAVVAMLEPIQTRYRELEADPGYVRDVLDAGAEKARAVASVTLARAKENIGLLPRA